MILASAMVDKLSVDVRNDGFGRIVRTAFGPVLERHEGLRRVLALAEKAESGEERNLVDAFALSEEVLDPFHRV